MKKFIEWYGWIGVLLILGAYALVSFDIVSVHSWQYQMMNLVGSGGIVIEALSKKDYEPTVLNIIWMLIAIIALVRIFAVI